MMARVRTLAVYRNRLIGLLLLKLRERCGRLGLPPEQSIDAVCGDGRAAAEENLGDPGTEVADVIRPEEFAGGQDDLRQAAHDLEVFGIEPSTLVTISLVHYAAANWGMLADPCCEERSVRDIVEGQRLAHEDDVICLTTAPRWKNL